MRLRYWIFAGLGLALAAAVIPACRVKYQRGLYAEITTNKGLIVIRLEFEKTPMTVANFVGLAEGSIDNAALPPGTFYFNGSKWHRVVPGHVIQCGMPGDGKAEGPGYQFPNEIEPSLNHDKAGMVGMASAGPHTNGSQWYITLGDRSYLNGNYTVFTVLSPTSFVFEVAGRPSATHVDLSLRVSSALVGADSGATLYATSNFTLLSLPNRAARL